MSNRKAHRRDRSFRRAEHFAQRRLERSERYERQIDNRRERRSVWKVVARWLVEFAEGVA